MFQHWFTEIMAWCRPGGKPLSEPMMARLTMISITRPQWVKEWCSISTNILVNLITSNHKHMKIDVLKLEQQVFWWQFFLTKSYYKHMKKTHTKTRAMSTGIYSSQVFWRQLFCLVALPYWILDFTQYPEDKCTCTSPQHNKSVIKIPTISHGHTYTRAAHFWSWHMEVIYQWPVRVFRHYM